MPTRGEVDRWNLNVLREYAAVLRAGNQKFNDEIAKMTRHVADAAPGWSGAAYNACSDRVQEDHHQAGKVAYEIGESAAAFDAAARSLESERNVLRAKVADAEHDTGNLSVADNWVVSGDDAEKVKAHQGLITAAYRSLVAAIDKAALDLQKNALEVRERGSQFGDGTVNDTAVWQAGQSASLTGVDGYKIGPPSRPNIKWDEDFGYDTRTANPVDYALREKWKAMLLAGEVGRTDLDDALALYSHYWDNDGKPVTFDYGEAYREDTGIKKNVDAEIVRAAAAADQMARDGRTNFSISGDAHPTKTYPQTENWQKAVGGYQQWSHSNVRVEGNRVVMDVTVVAEDHYNFNRGQNDIATGAADDQNGRFTEVGWAKPFDSTGSITTTVSWELGQPPPSVQVDPSGGPSRTGGDDRADHRGGG